MDGGGLDIVQTILAFWANMLHDPQRQADFLQTYVERGDLGFKSGWGFYTYPL
jgi:3-hydroxybutyryl-CoA dehydrogenase